MDTSHIPLDIVIYAAIAVFLLFWLFRILGTRNADEPQRPNPFTLQPSKGQGDATPAPAPDKPNLPENIPSGVEAGLVQIALADRNFDAARFVENAKDAFAMVVAAFADGDRAALKDLLAEPVYKGFDAAITTREQAGKKVTSEVVSIRAADIIAAELQGRTARVTIRFKADESYVETDAAGKVIAGHPEKLVTMTDVWVFARDVKSGDPRWLLSETRDDVREDNAPTLPEAGAS